MFIKADLTFRHLFLDLHDFNNVIASVVDINFHVTAIVIIQNGS